MAKLTFLGTGTSQGVPVISCHCRVCLSPDERDKRLRTAALIETGRETILIDAGPDFRQQMLRAGVERLDGILLTHEHKDHISGLDDVRAFNYTSGAPVKLYAEERVQKRVRQDFDYLGASLPRRSGNRPAYDSPRRAFLHRTDEDRPDPGHPLQAAGPRLPDRTAGLPDRHEPDRRAGNRQNTGRRHAGHQRLAQGTSPVALHARRSAADQPRRLF